MVIDNKESESKKIKKALIEYFNDNANNKVCDVPVRDVLDWLENKESRNGMTRMISFSNQLLGTLRIPDISAKMQKRLE